MEDTDFDYEELDPGIRETVRFLRGHGFTTSDSGDGKTKFEGAEPMACASPFANVVIQLDPSDLIAEANRLYKLLKSVGVTVGTVSDGEDEEAVEIQASYDPADGSGAIVVMFLDDQKLARVRTFS